MKSHMPGYMHEKFKHVQNNRLQLNTPHISNGIDYSWIQCTGTSTVGRESGREGRPHCVDARGERKGENTPCAQRFLAQPSKSSSGVEVHGDSWSSYCWRAMPSWSRCRGTAFPPRLNIQPGWTSHMGMPQGHHRHPNLNYAEDPPKISVLRFRVRF